MSELDDWVDKVFAAGGDRRTLDKLYDEWAKDYDQQLWASGNPYIAVAATIAGRHIPNLDAKILDAGCGTGNMAEVLHKAGYRKLHGLDPSAGMLEVARRKGIYQSLHPLSLGAQGRPSGQQLRCHRGIGGTHCRSRTAGGSRRHDCGLETQCPHHFLAGPTGLRRAGF